MSVYSSGVTAYRDTTKWLAAFVPVTGLVSAVVLVGPDLIVSAQTASSLREWLADYWLVVLSGIALFAGISAILISGAQVLSVEPTDIGKLAEPGSTRRKLEVAVGEGAALPEFFNWEDFYAAMSDLANRWDDQDQSKRPAADDAVLVRVKPAVESLREWSVFSRIQRPFRLFRMTFVVSSAIIIGALVLAPVQLSNADAIKKPTPVLVDVDTVGSEDLRAATDCDDAKTATFTAVGGTWEQPTLAVDGPGCRFGATWIPEPERIEVRTPPAA